MIRHFVSVTGWTLFSRVTGFIRDLVLAAVLGAGPFMDAFTVANRLPNHFRAIFAEGAFNAAFVPAYARALSTEGLTKARVFAGGVALLLFTALLVLTLPALIYMPLIIQGLAPGFLARPEVFELTVTLTRITFPYLVCMSLVTLLSGVLNAHERFAAAAAAPVLLNTAIILALWVAYLFPSGAHAAAGGVLAAGFCELILVYLAAVRAGVLPMAARPVFDQDMRGFFRALGPAVVGSAGTQLALFADTILVTYLAVGGASALYYADRLYQLPIGVIGIAAGTVVLPEMSRRLASGDEAGAYGAQNRTLFLTLLLSGPFLIAFLLTPTLLYEALFLRGAFDDEAARSAGRVLSAYAVGLPAIVLIRAILASFYARQDTGRPVVASLLAISANIALKIWLMPLYGAAGLALATALGAWINGSLLFIWALAKGWIRPDRILGLRCLAIGMATLLTAVCVGISEPGLTIFVREGGGLALFSPALILLALLATLTLMIYSLTVWASLKLMKPSTPL